MRPLAASQVLQVWELGESVDPLDRALLLLSAGDSDPHLVDLSIGERDARILLLRERTLGSSLSLFAACPHCMEQYEFTLETQDLLERHSGQQESYELACDPFTIGFRVPCSRDLAAARAHADVADASREIALRCIRYVHCDGVAVDVDSLPDAVLARLTAEMAERDPLAEVPLALDCAACGKSWGTELDIPGVFWAEIRAQALRLLSEVAELGRAYGWREADILGMSARRRRAYLELRAGP